MKESGIFVRSLTIMIATALTVAAFPLTGLWGTLTTLGYGCVLYTLQKTFQQEDAKGIIFYTFLFLGLASTIYIEAIVFIPVLWIAMAAFYGSMSIKAFNASILGVLTPYWFIVPIFILMGRQEILVKHFTSLVTDMQIPPEYGHLEFWMILTYVLLLVASIVCTMYYFQTDNQDNLHQRSNVKVFLMINLFSAALLIAQPQMVPCFIGMMTMSESMAIAVTLGKLKR